MSFNPNIISVSKPSEAFASFRGPMISYPIVKSINRETGQLRRWVVFSQGKRSTLVRYLWGKLLFDELNGLELKVFWHLNEITKDKSIYLSLKALALGVSKRKIRERLETNPFGLSFVSRQQYLSIKGRVNFFFLEETINLRTVTKYSGYCKHHKDKGSLGPEREEIFPQIFDPLHDVLDEVILKFLTVGEITFFQENVVFRPDEANKQKRFKHLEK